MPSVPTAACEKVTSGVPTLLALGTWLPSVHGVSPCHGQVGHVWNQDLWSEASGSLLLEVCCSSHTLRPDGDLAPLHGQGEAMRAGRGC